MVKDLANSHRHKKIKILEIRKPLLYYNVNYNPLPSGDSFPSKTTLNILFFYPLQRRFTFSITPRAIDLTIACIFLANLSPFQGV